MPKIVSFDKVEYHTRLGYELIAMYQEEHGDTIQCSEADPNADFAGALPMTIERPVQCTNSFFIMQLNEESAIAQLNSELKILNEKTTEIKNVAEETAKKLKEEAILSDRVREELKNSQNANSDYCKTIDKLRSVKQKMEKDIGKIREVIGSAKMTEILEAEEK